MRRTAFEVAALAVAITAQLTLLNGLRLPGGGVPDLVLVLVAALAMSDGPARGMVLGFAAGLCLDLAPPGSEVLGQYTLVFCLVGWAAGRLGWALAGSPLRSLLAVAVAVAAGEGLVAGIGLALDPAQVGFAAVRQVLPYSIGYDLLICPFLLYLVLLAHSLLGEDLAARQEAAGMLVVTASPVLAGRRGPAKRRPREARIGPGAGRPGDGWLSGGAHGSAGSRVAASRAGARTPRLRPGNGVAGSAAGGVVHRPGLRAATVNLRLASARRGDGAVGSAVGSGLGLHSRQPARHPGMHGPGRPSFSRHGFRPYRGEPGGSANRHRLAHPGSLQRPVSLRFGARRKDASVGRVLGAALSGVSPAGGGSRAVSVPRLRFRTKRQSPGGRRQAAAPRFRHAGGRPQPALSVGGGLLDQQTFRSLRQHRGSVPRLRLAAGRRRDGAVGGTARALRRGKQATPRFRSRPLVKRDGGARKRPRFGYGRRSVLSFLAGRRIGGRWLASRQVGSRSGVWLVGRRTGGMR
jgi:rod shape-determining protein MreD